jgi:hypothetical protein
MGLNFRMKIRGPLRAVWPGITIFLRKIGTSPDDGVEAEFSEKIRSPLHPLHHVVAVALAAC